ncbi:MAG: hypothetical protein ABI863_10510 [Ginsengibacter sp.]
MDNSFSHELKELVSQSREVAIDLGYDYISTIHFFIADCEMNRVNSIKKFGFKSEDEYIKFKKDYTLAKEDHLNFINDSLPLTKEAERTIRLSEVERILQKQKLVYPSHLFIAGLKNKESLLFECFKQDENALEKLVKYYTESGELDKSKMSDSEMSKQYYDREKKSKESSLYKFKRLFKSKK